MKLVKFKIIITFGLLFTVAVFAILHIYFEQNLNSSGFLLVSVGLSFNENSGVYSINLGKEHSLKEYIITDKFDYLSFPIVIGSSLFCIGENTKNQYFSIVEVKNKKVKEILKSRNKIHTFSLVPQKRIVYISEINNQSLLYSYDQNSQISTQLYKGEVDKNSKPIICSDGSIIFVAKEKKGEMIKILLQDGRITGLTPGKYPIIIESQNRLLFYNSGSIYSVNLVDKKIRVIVKHIVLLETPVLSPDKQYIAFFESDYVSFFSGEWANYLSVLSLKNKRKIHINSWSNAKICKSGLDWIQNL